jgi:DNA replication protein DnaC
MNKCQKHGEYESVFHGKLENRNCFECEKEIEVRKEHLWNEAKELAKKQRIGGAIEDSGIPPRFITCSLNNYKANTPDQKKALKESIDFVSNIDQIQKTGSAMFYCGSYGTGKTHLAIAIILELIKTEKINGRYTTTMRMIRDIRSSYSNRDLSEQGLIDKYVSVPLLVIDEVGVQMGTDAEKLLIYEVVNGRYENFRPTILISNLSFTDMTKYLGARSIDRLKSKQGSMIVMSWESWRKDDKKELQDLKEFTYENYVVDSNLHINPPDERSIGVDAFKEQKDHVALFQDGKEIYSNEDKDYTDEMKELFNGMDKKFKK